MRESAKIARQYGVKLHTHLCETLDEERYTLQNKGLRPVAYMESLDWVGDDVWYAHAVHVNDDEVRLTREHNDANVLALGAKFTSPEEAGRMAETFLNTGFSGGVRHQRRIAKMAELEHSAELQVHEVQPTKS